MAKTRETSKRAKIKRSKKTKSPTINLIVLAIPCAWGIQHKSAQSPLSLPNKKSKQSKEDIRQGKDQQITSSIKSCSKQVQFNNVKDIQELEEEEDNDDDKPEGCRRQGAAEVNRGTVDTCVGLQGNAC